MAEWPSCVIYSNVTPVQCQNQVSLGEPPEGHPLKKTGHSTASFQDNSLRRSPSMGWREFTWKSSVERHFNTGYDPMCYPVRSSTTRPISEGCRCE